MGIVYLNKLFAKKCYQWHSVTTVDSRFFSIGRSLGGQGPHHTDYKSTEGLYRKNTRDRLTLTTLTDDHSTEVTAISGFNIQIIYN